MSRYNTIILNDVTNGEGVCVSLFVQGCPHHCPGCFNPETWDFNEGKPYSQEIKWEIIKAISANGIERNFSILGGEPLALQNIEMVEEITKAVRIAYPDIKIFLWTGYTFEDVITNNYYTNILSNIDVIIDGKFIEKQKDLNLKLRGSTNQNIWTKQDNKWRKNNG